MKSNVLVESASANLERTQDAGKRRSCPGRDWNRLIGKCCLNAFLLIGWLLSISLFIWEELAGESVARGLNLYGGLGYPVLLGAAIFFYERSRRRAVRVWKGYATLFLLSFIGMAFYGSLRGNAIRVMIFDFMVFATFFGTFVLGRRDEIWEDSRSIVILLSGVSIAMAVTQVDSSVLFNRSILNESSGSYFETGLVLAPLFCIVAVFDRKVWRYYLLLALTAGCLFVYLYFGRRGVSVRCALELLIAALVVPMLIGKIRRGLLGGVVIVSVGIALLLYFPFGTLIDRYLGWRGVMSTVTVENERWNEVQLMMEEFSDLDFLIGRGVGGAFLVNADSPFFLDFIDQDSVGRFVTHAGAALPVLKGGVLFWTVYYLPMFVLFSRVFKWRRLDSVTMAALSAAFPLFSFQFIEGAPTYGTPWVAFGIGLVMSRAQNALSVPLKEKGS